MNKYRYIQQSIVKKYISYTIYMYNLYFYFTFSLLLYNIFSVKKTIQKKKCNIKM